MILAEIPRTDPSTVLNNWALLGLAAINMFAIWLGKRRGDQHEKAQKESVRVREVDQEANAKQLSAIHTLVNGPLGVALDALAAALERQARTSRDPEEILAAVTARRASDDHRRKQNEANDLRRESDENKARIIAAFLAEHGGGKP